MSENQTEARQNSVENPPATSKSSLLSLTAIVLSLSALGVSVLEVSAIRDEQRVQVWPYVELTENFNAEGFGLYAINKGIGPARIRTLSMSFQDQVYDNLDELILNTLGEENAFSYDVYRSSNPARSVMSPGQEVVLFQVPWEPRTRLLAERWSEGIELSLCFCSVYDDCWETRLSRDEPQPVEECGRPDTVGP